VSGTTAAAREYRGRGYGQPFGATERKDTWWLTPLAQALGLVLLFGYATWAALQGRYYEVLEGGRHYLSPVYSPKMVLGWWPFSPALLALAAPGGFRATCYYYRKAYYRAFFADPPACAVGEPRKGYGGEATFPLILQNIHRYFMYLALLWLVFLWHDVIDALNFGGRFGIGGGTLAILASTGLLTMYTLSCHSLRHMIGGKIDCFSCVAAGGPRQKVWSGVSVLNEHHMMWAWLSLVAVCFADFYVRLVAMGVIHDPIFVRF
jgi:hypothetical protein